MAIEEKYIKMNMDLDFVISEEDMSEIEEIEEIEEIGDGGDGIDTCKSKYKRFL